ncbi:transposase [Schlesneria paludicola]|uniref:transposase n=1 Tax=Schlesneria paludicola TaxID=360056 RepID=UPI000492A6A5
MGRPKRATPGGMIYHVLNRANARLPIFESDDDYMAFERVLAEAVERTQTRLLSYCLLQNHWHLVVWPREEGELSRFVGWLTLTHTQRWHAHRESIGAGHLYQGRFKSFPVQDDEHFLTVCRYVERNPLRANLVEAAEDWRWSSLHRWCHGTAEEKSLLTSWPIRRSSGWVQHVNEPQTDLELAAIRRSVNRGGPFGTESWSNTATARLGLEMTTRPRGRPLKNAKKGS